MLGLDHYAPFLLSAFGITVVTLGGYALYLRSRLMALRRRSEFDYSARNVSAARWSPPPSMRPGTISG